MPPSQQLLDGIPPENAIAASERVKLLYAAIHAARNLRSEFKIPSKQQVRFLITAKAPLTSVDQAVFASLTRASEVDLTGATPPTGTPSIVTDLGVIYMPLEGLVDVESERIRINAEITKVVAELAKVDAKLSDQSFVEKVPAAVLEDHRQRHQRWSEKLETLGTTLKNLG
jgi:valyl-tRNA synthetase